MIIDNFYAALFSNAVAIGAINPDGELDYKGYKRKLFCSVRGKAIEDITFDKAQEDSVDSATHVVIMTHKGRVMYSNLITHSK